MSIKKYLLSRSKSDEGFAGHTHALFALCIYLLLFVYFPVFMYGTFLKTRNIFVFFASVVVVVGFSLWADFDNLKSIAISTFGVLGKAMSVGMRTTATAIYHITKTRYDDPTANPHRLFWHTIVSAILVGLCVFPLIIMPGFIPIAGHKYPLKFIWVCFIIFISSRLALGGLFGSVVKKFKRKTFGMFFLLILCLTVSIAFVFLLPESVGYKWIVYSVILGYSLHLFADCFTRMGSPLFAPFIKIKGKRWYYIRILGGIESGGMIETMFLIPMFSILTIYAIFKIIGGTI